MKHENNWFERTFAGKFRFRYEYVSPFGEYWSVYRLWFGFIPFEYMEKVYQDMYDVDKIKNFVKELNNEKI
jgi:hypothetical protein